MQRRPPRVRDGAPFWVLPKAMFERNAEEALIVEFASHRKLFGDAYCQLQREYFWDMPHGSGVFIRPLIRTKELAPGAVRPGDIDLLVVPYESDDLVLERSLALEIKVVRASYARQGRSPNDMGFSQAEALLELGFPYVAVAHLILSDASPVDAWRKAYSFKVLDDFGRVGERVEAQVDFMPMDLVARVFGRLNSMCLRPDLGLASVYVRRLDQGLLPSKPAQTWNTECRAAGLNQRTRPELLRAIGDLFQRAPERWLDTPRFDPRRTP